MYPENSGIHPRRKRTFPSFCHHSRCCCSQPSSHGRIELADIVGSKIKIPEYSVERHLGFSKYFGSWLPWTRFESSVVSCRTRYSRTPWCTESVGVIREMSNVRFHSDPALRAGSVVSDVLCSAAPVRWSFCVSRNPSWICETEPEWQLINRACY